MTTEGTETSLQFWKNSPTRLDDLVSLNASQTNPQSINERAMIRAGNVTTETTAEQ